MYINYSVIQTTNYFFASHPIRLFLNWYRSWKVLWHPVILQSTM